MSRDGYWTRPTGKVSPGAWGPEATSGESAGGAEPLSHLARAGHEAYFLPAFFLPATVRFGPLRVRAFVRVR